MVKFFKNGKKAEVWGDESHYNWCGKSIFSKSKGSIEK